jgi:hypothetical protein
MWPVAGVASRKVGAHGHSMQDIVQTYRLALEKGQWLLSSGTLLA